MMRSSNSRKYVNIATEDTRRVANELGLFLGLAKQHHLDVFVLSSCYKQYGHFEPASLRPAEMLDFIKEHQSVLGYAVQKKKVMANGSGEGS